MTESEKNRYNYQNSFWFYDWHNIVIVYQKNEKKMKKDLCTIYKYPIE